VFNFSEYPFVRLTLWLIGGILMSSFFCLAQAVAVLIGLLIGWFFLEKKKLFNGLSGLVIMATGILIALQYNLKDQPQSVYQFKNQMVVLSGSVEGELQNKTYYQSGILGSLCLIENGQVTPLLGKILIKLPKDYKPLTHNDKIITKTYLEEIPPAVFDGLFDYQKYLERKQVYLQMVINEKQTVSVISQQLSPMRLAIYLKHKVIHWFNLYLDNNSAGLAIALITGEDEQVDNPLIVAFKNTGTLHLLAVSGMHVGLIFLLLNLLFKPFKKKRSLQIFFDVITLGAIWLFCMVAGLSDSVVRAGCMISFVLGGHILSKKSNTLNLVFASIFCMLAYNPNYLYNAGFQLSVSAVLGIFCFYKPFKLIVNSKYNWLNKLWEALAISLAAQAGTFVVSIYYFYQFPVWFLISNLVLVPFSTFIIYGSLVLLIVTPVKWLAVKTGFAVSWIIKLFIKSLFILNAFPYLLISPITLNLFQAFILIGFLLITYWVINYKNYRLIKVQGLFILLFTVSLVYKEYNLSKIDKYYVLNQKQEPIWVQQNGKNIAAIYNKELTDKTKNTIQSFATQQGVNNIAYYPIKIDSLLSYFKISNHTYINEKGLFSVNKKYFHATPLKLAYKQSKKGVNYPVLAYTTKQPDYLYTSGNKQTIELK